MSIPEDVCLDRIGAAFLGSRDEAGPHGGDAAGVVNGGRDEEPAAAVDDEGAVIVRDIGRRNGGEQDEDGEEKERAKACYHNRHCWS